MREQATLSFPPSLGVQRGQRPTAFSTLATDQAQAFNILVAVAVVMHLLFDGTNIVQGLAYSSAIKFGFLALLLILALRDGGPLGRPATLIVLVYGLMSIQSFLVVPVSENIASSIWGTEKFLYRSFITFWALSKCFESRLVRLDAIVNVWLGVAVYFAIGAISLFILTWLLDYNLPSVTIDLPRVGRVGGSLEIVGGLGIYDAPPRLQSFFSEANKFAQFLVFPFFLLLAMKATLRNYVFLLVVSVAFLLTFSAASTAGLLIGLVLWVGLRIRTQARRRLLLGGGSLLLALVFIFVAQGIWARYQVQPGDSVYYQISANKSPSLDATLAQLKFNANLAFEKPLGVGMIDRAHTEVWGFRDLEKDPAGGLAEVLGRSGWPGLLLYGIIFLVAWRTMIRYAAEVRAGAADPRGLALGVAYFALLIAATNFGPYDQRTLIVSLALFLSYVHRQKMQKQSH